MPRHSFQSLGKIYFWTATIHQWKLFLLEDEMKDIIIQSLQFLSEKKLIVLYAFVIMPNHMHIIWKPCKMNGKEKPNASFLKFTAHEFLKIMKQKKITKQYEVNKSNKKHCIWKRDSMAIELYSKKVMMQKLRYIHKNPIAGKWKLSTNEISYRYSSALFYETGEDEFGLLNDIFAMVRVDTNHGSNYYTIQSDE